MPLSFWSSTELMNRRNRHLFAIEKLLLLLILTSYLRLQNRRFGSAQIFKSQIPFIYAGFQTTVDDRRRQICRVGVPPSPPNSNPNNPNRLFPRYRLVTASLPLLSVFGFRLQRLRAKMGEPCQAPPNLALPYPAKPHRAGLTEDPLPLLDLAGLLVGLFAYAAKA